MENNWVILTADTMPPPNTLVWIKRKGGSMYFGIRKDKPLSTNPDASRDCHWYANQVEKALETDVYGDWHPRVHFSDVTVESWMPIQIPGEHGYQM